MSLQKPTRRGTRLVAVSSNRFSCNSSPIPLFSFSAAVFVRRTTLHLSHNELSGSIPSTFKSGATDIRPIRYMNLYSNRFTGTIPDNLRFRKLTFADLGRNEFTGTLPEDIGLRWVELRYLYLNHNRFTGTIPESYPTTGNGRVETMAFNHNDLTGYVPGQFYHNKLRKYEEPRTIFCKNHESSKRFGIFI